MLLLTETITQFDLSSLELGLGEICLRLLCAMVIGMIIGTEREYTNRPAGMRTHILVALGACAVMITSQLIFVQYKAFGSTADPARLSAQVITGVGFLGAGTILRDGVNVKGLTTAASLWAVACLGIAAGGGYYVVALAGMVFIFITLTILEVFQHKLISTNGAQQQYHLETDDLPAGLHAINTQAHNHRAGISNMMAQQLPNGCFRVSFEAEFGGIRVRQRREKFFSSLAASQGVKSVRLDGSTETIHMK